MARRHGARLFLLFLLAAVAAAAQTPSDKIAVGSKNFTENTLLAEVMAQLIEGNTDLEVERKTSLGGTLVAFTALREGEVDLYPEYTGTGWSAVLKREDRATDSLTTYLHVADEYQKRFDVSWLRPFGFSNSYAVAVYEETAERLGLRRISDLAEHRDELRAGWSIEFTNREDGLLGLDKAYGLDIADTRSMEHTLAYEAIRRGRIDLTDAYTTDGKLLRFPVRILEDDRGFFPPYHAAPIVRSDTLERHPELEDLLNRLAGSLPDERMQRLNFEVEENGRPFADVARAFLVEEGVLAGDESEAAAEESPRGSRGFGAFLVERLPETAELIGEHLFLTCVAVALAILLAVPAGILLTRKEALTGPILGIAGMIQTIPSLALLAFMIPIPLLGLGVRSAIVALFLYALLPILRNTYTGIKEVDSDVVEASRGMGLYDRQILWRVQLPLAMPTIMAGIRTSTVISIGVATLAAFIGAGGLGEPIATGLYLNDTQLILAGAIPAALLAIAADFLLGRVEKALRPFEAP